MQKRLDKIKSVCYTPKVKLKDSSLANSKNNQN